MAKRLSELPDVASSVNSWISIPLTPSSINDWAASKAIGQALTTSRKQPMAGLSMLA